MKNFKMLACALLLSGAGHAVCSDVASNEKQSSSVLQKSGIAAQKTLGVTQVAVGTGGGLMALGCLVIGGKWGWDGYKNELKRMHGNPSMVLKTCGHRGALFAGIFGGCAYLVHNGISRFKNNTFNASSNTCTTKNT